MKQGSVAVLPPHDQPPLGFTMYVRLPTEIPRWDPAAVSDITWTW